MGIQEIKRIFSVGNTFVMMMTLLTGFFLWDLLSDPMGIQLNVFFRRTEDFMADFFNVQRYIADWDPYHNTINGLGEKCYLPFTYLFLELFNGFFHYSDATLSDCYASSTAMLSCVMFVLLSVMVFYHALNKLVACSTVQKVLIFFSSIMLFAIERGNMIILCAALLCYFLAYKDAASPWKRVFALSCLCIISVIKIYPVVFGLFLLRDKRYRAIAYCIVLSLLMVFLPFLFFKGQFDNISQLLTNLSVFAETYNPGQLFPRFGIIPMVATISIFLQSTLTENISNICALLTMLMCLASILLFFFEKTPWKQTSLLALPLLMYPTNSAFYCGLYMLPVLFLFLRDSHSSSIDYIYMLSFCILLNPFQIVIGETTVSWMLSNIAVIFFWLLLLVDTGNQCIRSTFFSRYQSSMNKL